MDPTATWVDLSQAVADDKWGRAGELADSLIEWLAKGGFPPVITGVREFDIIAARAACDAIAAWEIA